MTAAVIIRKLSAIGDAPEGSPITNVQRKTEEIVWSLPAILREQLKLLITRDKIFGMAFAAVQAGDKVCLLDGFSKRTPIILRKVVGVNAGDTYRGSWWSLFCRSIF